MKQLRSIQYLRGIAALGVVVYHEAEDSSQWFDIGAYGVDLFFMISGFIMFAITEREEQNPGLFFSRQLTRIGPLYWLITLFSVFLCLVHPHLMWDEDVSPRHLLLSLFFIPDRSRIFGNVLPTLLQGWTLNIEMFFYAVFALALFLPRRFQLVSISLVLLGLVAVGFPHRPHAAIPRVYTNPHMIEFVAGLWIGRLWTAGKLPNPATPVTMVLVGSVMLGLEQYGTLALPPLLAGGPAVLILIGAISLEEKGALFKSAALTMLGDASYSIYLSHSIVQAVVNRLHLPPAAKISCAIALSVIFGVLLFRHFERPLNRLVRGVFAPASGSRPAAHATLPSWRHPT